MAEALKFELVSPEALLLSEEVDSVVVPGSEGEMTVMAQHAPVMTTIKPGVLEVNGGSEASRKIFVRGGFADINPGGLTVLAEFASPLADFSASDLDQQIKNAEEDVADAKSDAAREAAQSRLEQLKDVRGQL